MLKSEKAKEIIKKEKYDFNDLVEIMQLLRGEGGCPWDAEQTHESIRTAFIEETYEVIEAIDNKDVKLLKEELGDVMLQVVFHAQIEAENRAFDINDVIDGICKKLVNRHPHIFGDLIAESSDEVLKEWDAIKSKEKNRNTVYEKLKSVPPMTPALIRAEKISSKSEAYKNVTPSAINDMIRAELNKNDLDSKEFEGHIGRVLFLISALCGKKNIDAEKALFDVTQNFIEEYKDM